MSQSIDNRIVNMIFNNQEFEEGVSETTESLDKLKKSLDFDDLKNGIKNVDLSGIADGVGSLTKRFSAFGEFAAKIIRNFADDVYRTTKNLVNDAVVKPITDGFDEYQLKMGSVQTILNSAVNRSGAKVSLEEVNYQLEELNKYADRTIYSFRDMTTNIGKFTNAGVALEDAVAAIQGVSNVAAISGANANEASRAMYNFAQALSAGYVKLIDWKSIENANMATVEFKQQLIDTAVAMGTLEARADGTYKVLTGGGFFEGKGKEKIEKYISATQNFNDSLSKAWMTSEVLTTTLAKYSDETTELGKRAFAAATEVKTLSQAWDTLREAAGSSWAQTFEIIFGDFNEGKKLWTRLEQDLETIFVKGSERRNEFIQSWVDLGGRGSLFETTEDNLGALWNLLDIVKILINTVKTAFTDVFGSPSAQMLANLTERFRKFTEKISTNIRLFRTIGSLFRGFFSAVALVGDAFKAVIKPIGDFFNRAIPRKNNFIEGLGAVGDAVTKFRESLLENGFFDELTDRFSKMYKALGRFAHDTAEDIKDFISLFKGNDRVIDSFGDHNIAITSKVGQAFNILRNAIKSAATAIADVIASAFGLDRIAAVKKVTDIFNGIENAIYKVYDTIKSADIINKLKDFWYAMGGEGTEEKLKGLWSTIKEGFSTLTSQLPSMEKFKGLLSAIFDFLKKAAVAIFPSLTDFGSFALDLIDKVVDGLTSLFKALAEGLSTGSLADTINGVFKVGIGYSFFKSVDSLSEMIDTLSEAFSESGTVGNLIKQLTKTLKAMENEVDSKALRNIAVSIGVLAVSLLLLAGIDASKLTAASIALSLLMRSLVTLMTSKLGGLEQAKSMMQTATSLTLIAAAVLTLATALKKLGQMKLSDLAKGMTFLTGVLAELLYTVTFLSSKSLKETNAINEYVKMIQKLANAVILFSIAMKIIATMSWGDIAKGAAVITGLLTELTAMSAILAKVTKGGGSITKAGGDMILLAAAMILFATSVKMLGSTDVNSLANGLAAFSGILILVYGMALMFSELDSKKLLVASGALIIFGTAMMEMSVAFKLLSTIDMTSMIVALAALVGILTTIGLLMTALAKLDTKDLLLTASSIMTVSEAILVMSVALSLLGHMNIVQLSAGFLAIVAALVLFGVAAKVLKPVYDDMERLAKTFLMFGAAAALFAVALALVSVSLATIGGSLVIVVAAMIESVKLILTALPDLLAATADSLSNAFESIVGILVTIFEALIESFKQIYPKLIETCLEIADQILAALAEHVPAIVESVLKIIAGIFKGIGQGFPEIIKEVVGMFKGVFQALADAFEGELNPGTVAEMIGIVSLIGVLMAEIAVVVAIGAVATVGLPIIGLNLSMFMDYIQPFIEGIAKVDSKVLEGAEALGAAVLALTAASILDGLTRWITGKSSFEAFGKELAAFGPYLKQYNDSIKTVSTSAITASAEAVKTMADMANDLPNSGGIISWFEGDNTLADFGKMLAEFGPYFKKYADSIVGINPTAVTASATAAASLADMANSLPNSGGLISWISGDNTLSDFGAMLADFGPYLKKYADSVVGLNVPAIAASVTGATYLVSIANAIKLIDVDSKNGPISYFGEQIAKMAGSIYSYAAFMEAINWTAFATSVEEINKLVDLSDRISLVNVDNLTTFGRDIKTLANNGINMFILAFTNAFTKAYNKGAEFAKKAVGGINSTTGQFTNAGANAMQGFINGLNSRAQAVYNTANAIANNAANAIRRALQIHSPSRVMEQIGMYTDLGFANGLMRYADTVEESADYVGMDVLNTMASAIQDAVDYVDYNPDFSPTITPVLDLTNVDHGLGRLGDSLNSSRLQATGYYRTSMDLAGMVMDTNMNNQNGGAVLNTMMQMMDEIANLSAAVENMQIVMDSGVVVGAIAPKMDAALGRRVAYKGRGN